jgi:outer membrane protein assembly factor BamA
MAQNEYVTINSITIEGNRRTKEKIILRELDFEIGDTISTEGLMNRLERNRVLLMNADLFNNVEFNVSDWSNGRVDLKIEVVEDWYFFPLLVVDFADRNFNVWWVEQNRALNRINLGLYLIHTNFTGRRDYMKAVGQIGYTQRLHLYYSRPYLNKAQTVGGLFNIFYSRNHEVGYKAEDNILQFHREDEDFTLRRLFLDIGLNYRPQIRARHQATINYRDFGITDSVAMLNPNFFLDGDTRLQYFSFDYSYIYDYRDFSRYPMKGYFVEFNLLKEGFGIFNEINSLYLTGTYGKYWKVGKKWSFGGVVKGRKGLINQIQPYYNSRALGYEEDFLSGYEYYVIDGQDFIFGKAFARFELLNVDINLGRAMPIKAFKILPLKYYLRVYTDHGYVNAPYHSEGNPLANEYLRSFGIGLDTVLYHDYVFRLEYSMNHLMEGGVYFNYRVSF